MYSSRYSETSETTNWSYQGESSSSSNSTGNSFPSSCSASRRMDVGDLDFIKFLGTGGSGKVYLARDKVTEQHLAVKIMPKRGLFDNLILSEKNIHAFLTLENDDHFLPLFACWQDDVYYYLASEYVAGGDFAMQLLSRRIVDEDSARFYTCELIIALEHLHARRIIHRDIKPSNILLRPDGHIVLADFGVSRRFERYSPRLVLETSKIYTPDSETAYLTTDDCGTSYFMSPEQHRGDPYSFEADYWAVGVILYRMVTGKMPFGNDETDKHAIARSVLEDDLTFPVSDNISPVTRDLMYRLLDKNPCNRLHPCYVRNHPFFARVDWTAIESRKLEAPWRPYVASLPKHTRTNPRVDEKAAYVRAINPLLTFTWYNPTSQSAGAQPSKTCFPLQTFDTPAPSRRSDTRSTSMLFARLKSWARTMLGSSQRGERKRSFERS